jgi:hypothetical protein
MALKRAQKRTEFRKLRELAGLTFSESMDLLKLVYRTAHRYEQGETKPPKLALDILRQEAEKRLAAEQMPAGFRFIDLFAGIGGLRLGFQSIGGRCVFTSEWDMKCQETYALNFPDNHLIAGDIREYSDNPGKIPAHDVLLAGFPCQPFSIAGVSKKNALGRPHGFLCDSVAVLHQNIVDAYRLSVECRTHQNQEGENWQKHVTKPALIDSTNALVEIDDLAPVEARVDVADGPAFCTFQMRGDIVPIPLRQVI